MMHDSDSSLQIQEMSQSRVVDVAQKSAAAAPRLAQASTCEKNEILTSLAHNLRENSEEVISANIHDVEKARSGGVNNSLIDRLLLDGDRVEALAQATEKIVDLDDPVGHVLQGKTLENGLELLQKSVPLGVVGAIYEARPNVTVDIAALCIKSGNAVILRGGSLAYATNQILVELIQKALESHGFSSHLAVSIDAYGRAGAVELMKYTQGFVDVLIPRGGKDLIETVMRTSTIPVIQTGEGNVHIYIDQSAQQEMVEEIVINAKVQRPSVCNAVETLLINAQYPHIHELLAALQKNGVTIHGSQEFYSYYKDYLNNFVDAVEKDWKEEYLDLDIAVAVVESTDEALEHIAEYSTGHTEAILSEDYQAIQDFVRGVNSSTVIVNASTRFTDGAMFGFGAEVGISTSKLHARGPMGLPALTSAQWVVYGNGQVRQ